MHDPDTQAALDRIGERNQWIVGWFLCGVTTLLAVFMIAEDWHHRALLGKIAAGTFLVFLVIVPVALVMRVRRGKPVTIAWVFSLIYIVLMMALQAFGPATRMH